jgi:superfamily II DNA helicase RecQ
MALSASASPPLAKVIEESLHLKSPHHVCHSLDRPNIFLSISKSKGLAVSNVCCLNSVVMNFIAIYSGIWQDWQLH